MKEIIIKDDIIPEREDLLTLYNDVEWSAYTSQPDQLVAGLENSLKVWTAWDGDQLVGLGRVVGDDQTIIYLQDLLVLKAYQGQGIGSRLIQTILAEYESVRQFILLTGNDENTVNFYQKNGFIDVREYDSVAFTKKIGK